MEPLDILFLNLHRRYLNVEAKYPNCAARKNFLAWLKSDGLKLLKKSFVRQKTKRRKEINLKQQLLQEVENWNGAT